jgi:formylglycine-generating enzyme required for sulfatase activity
VEAARERLVADLRRATGMAFVPPGTFLAGCDRTEESLSAFLIDATEVSNTRYAGFLAATGRAPPAHWPAGHPPAGQGSHPVIGVSYDDALAFAEWDGKRLPTALEWEKAARGTDGRTWPWGETFAARLANVRGSTDGLRDVASTPEGASPCGCLHMAGNAHEWTASPGPYPGTRIVRGGAFRSHPSNARTFASHPVAETETDPGLAIGFRCAR